MSVQDDTHEGIHYIFDRYAFLNNMLKDGGYDQRVSEASSQADIESSIKLGRIMYHPDRQARSGEQMRKTAERMTGILAECADFLLNPAVKPLYDEKLAEFRSKKPHLVSDNGSVIIDLRAPRFHFESLLREDIADTSDLEHRIKEMTQYDETATAKAKSLYTKFPEDDDIRLIYRDALTKQLTYLALLEDAAWMKVGHYNRKSTTKGTVFYADQYGEAVENALQESKEADIAEAIEARTDLLRIGMATPLLLTFQSAAREPIDTSVPLDPAQFRDLMDSMKKKAAENFEIRADYVRDIAKQKQDVLIELSSLSPTVHLNTHNELSPVYDIYLVDDGDDGIVWLRMNLNVQTAQSSLAETYDGSFRVSDLKAKDFDVNSLAVIRNPEIDETLVEVTSAAQRLLDKYHPIFSAPKTAPEPFVS